MDFVLIVIVVT